MTTIFPEEPTSAGNWRTADDHLDNPENLRDRLLPFDGQPPGEGGGQPQILSVENLNGNARITVSCPSVPGADRFEWSAGSNTGPERWALGPAISFESVIVFEAPRQEDVNDNSFFCYRGANEFGTAPTYHCNGFVIEGVDTDPEVLGAPDITGGSASGDGESVTLTLASGANADNHDVHRVLGDVNFAAGTGNRIATDIGQVISSYQDSTVTPENIYSYRVTSKKAGFTPVESNRFVVSTAVNESPPPQGDYTGLHPNEPNGFSRWLEHDFTGQIEVRPLSHAGFISWTDAAGNYTTVVDPSMSSSSALRIRYPNGFPDGVSPGRFTASDTDSTSTSTPLREWYVSLWIKLEAHSSDGGWEMPPAGNKLWYNGYGRRGHVNNGGYIMLRTGGGPAVRTSVETVLQTDRPELSSIHGNYFGGQTDFPVGPWNHIEVLQTLSTPGVHDATIRTWCNGVLWQSTEAAQNQGFNDWDLGFYGLHWAPVWGGTCGAGCPRTRTDFMRIGHIYVSGIPQ